MLNIVTGAIEHKLEVDLVYLDFAQAIDSLPQRKFILKLEKCGISGRLLLLL